MKLRQHRRTLVPRVARLHGAIQLCLLIVGAGYWLVQIAEGSAYLELAENNRLREISLEAPRGLIRDRHGRPLVENVPRYSLLIDRSRTTDIEASLAFAAEILRSTAEEQGSIEPEPVEQESTEPPSDRSRADIVAELRATLEDARKTPDFKPVLLAESLALRQVARFSVEHLEHPEFEIAVSHLRFYRHGHQTAHLLGHLGEVTDRDLSLYDGTYRAGDTIGRSGVESLYESHLRGSRGEQVVIVDSRGQISDEFRRSPAKPGADLTLTVDLTLQQEAARQLAGKVGAIVVLDPRQGEVLAMVSEPSFNPNRFARRLHPEEWRQVLNHPHHPLQNRALQNSYPPGSVFKVIMALAGLDLGLIDPQRTVSSCRGFSRLFNHTYRCWHAGGHGRVDLRQSLKRSCNVFYHQLGLEIDVDQIAVYSRLFGLGRATGIDLGGEKSGLVPDRFWSLERRGAPWYPGETISVATGQGPLLVTPMQIAVMTAAVANGGRLVVPHLVRGRGPVRVDRKPAQEISSEHLQRVREAMWSVVNEPRGTGVSARVQGLDIAGKTGTAQVIKQETRTDSEDLPPEQRDHAWFASFAPADDPRLVVVVFVEHGGAGSRAAAPLAKPIYEAFLELEASHGGPAA